MCQNVVINSANDFCLWGPPGTNPADNSIGKIEEIVVAYVFHLSAEAEEGIDRAMKPMELRSRDAISGDMVLSVLSHKTRGSGSGADSRGGNALPEADKGRLGR